jgi:hypothetical protein
LQRGVMNEIRGEQSGKITLKLLRRRRAVG